MDNNIVTFSIIGLIIMLIAIIFIIIFACTKSRREYNRIKNMAEAVGTITDIEHITSTYDGGSGGDYYIVRYSFTDICGKIHNSKFKKFKIGDFKNGDNITVYYDIGDPDKCVTDHKLNSDKNLWWKGLVIAAVIIVVSFVFAFAVSKQL